MSMIGKTLGTFECTALLGKGGMGEVYRAKDQKLGRDVAIKVLPEEFAKDADRVARFQREAKLLASLNHSNIAAIHGLEEAGGTHFLVLELIEGDTLADRLKRGTIPVEESLKLALQIAEALEAAHEKGVIHRDLKPANIKVTSDGKVKVLDFGLAKAFAGEQAEVNLSHSPTLSEAATLQGVILGTAAYMSPEQARGETVDKKADIWSFGCVLYEMLTGREIFGGRTVSDILASVLKSEPEWKSLPANLHPRIRLLLERCLEKESKDRYHDVADARIDIQKVLADPSSVLAKPVVGFPARMPQILPWFAAAIVLGAVIAGITVWNLKPASPPEPRLIVRLDHDLPEDQQFSNLVYPYLSVSPDGRRFVYSTTKGLYTRSMDELEVKLIPGTEGNNLHPFFSPDGHWVGYWSEWDNKLKKVSISGGAPVSLCSTGGVLGANWGIDNTIVYCESGSGIWKISGNGGTPETLIEADNETFYHPRLLPDGRSVIFTLGTDEGYKIAVQSLGSNERKVLFAGDYAWYLPTGHIIFGLGNSIAAIAFDLDTLNAAGGSVPIVEGVYRAGVLYPPQFAVSDSGTLVYLPESTATISGPIRNLVWIDRNGKKDPLPVPADIYNSAKISPDGTRLALTIGALGSSDIWIRSLIKDTKTRLTFNPGADAFPLWTPDGKRIIFWSNTKAAGSIYSKAADGTGKEDPVGTVPGAMIVAPFSWSADEKTLVLSAFGTGFDIGTISMEGENKWKPLFQEIYVEAHPQISPDGKWIAYTSEESGRWEIFVRPFPEIDNGKWQVSTNNGHSPLWSPDGRELFYRNGDAIMVVKVETEPTFKWEKPSILFRGSNAPIIAENILWDISPDGKRFLMMEEAETEKSSGVGPRQINIVLNWFEELKERAPAE